MYMAMRGVNTICTYINPYPILRVKTEKGYKWVIIR